MAGRPKRTRADAGIPADSDSAEGDGAVPLDAEQLDGDEDCTIDGGADGSFTLSRRRRAPAERADRDADDLPDEPPPGWCEP